MRNLRPALLVLLTSSLTGLGAPAGFAQSKAAAKNSNTKNASHKKAAATKRQAPTYIPTARSHQLSSTATTKSVKPSSKPSATSAKKGPGKSARKSRKQPGQKAPASDRVIEIQSALAKDGSFQGSPSGKWDDDTTVAMRKFQASHGLNPSGKLDAPTLQRLGLGSQTAGVAAPIPPPGSFSRLTSSNNAPSGTADSPRHP